MDAAEKKPSLLDQAKACFKQAEDLWADNRKQMLEAIKFRIPGGQWPEKLRADREAQNLPCLEVDKLNQYVRQVVNDGRQNRPAVKVRPEDDGGDVKVAEAYQGLIRRICNRSNLDEALDTALDHAATGGFGFLRVLTEMAHAKTFNQEIAIRRVRNPLSAMLGPHYLADGSDAEYGFFLDEVPKKVFTKQFPKAKVTDWSDPAFGDKWSDQDHVRVCEFFYREDVTIVLHYMPDGTYVTDEELQLKLKNLTAGEKPPQPIESRPVPGKRVKWCRLTGAEVLEEKDWLGKYIPIIPVYGNEFDVGWKVILSGLIRSGMDPQRLHNYMRSKFAERVALTPMVPWVAAEEAVEGHPEWDSANSGKHAVLVYKSIGDNGEPIPAPTRVNPTDIPAGFAEDMQMSEHDIRAALGMHKASLGEESNEKSGKAIIARQREGDVATFHYQDNLNRAIRYLGRILVDLIPKVYDNKRVVRLMAEDGTLTEAMVDPKLPQPYEKGSDGRMIYNLGVGTYDVVVEAGPSYTTKRQEAAEAMMQLTQANPDFLKVAGDLMVRNMDWPGADQIADRLKALLPPELQQENESDSPEVATVKMQAKRAMDQLSAQLEEATAAAQKFARELEAEKAKKDADIAKARADLMRAETEARKLDWEMQQPGAPDTSVADAAKLDFERDRLAMEDKRERDKMELDAAVKVIVATIGAESKAAAPAGDGTEPVPGGPEVLDETNPMNEAIAAAIGEFKLVLDDATMQLRNVASQVSSPRKIVRGKDGSVEGVEIAGQVRKVSRDAAGRIEGL